MQRCSSGAAEKRRAQMIKSQVIRLFILRRDTARTLALSQGGMMLSAMMPPCHDHARGRIQQAASKHRMNWRHICHLARSDDSISNSGSSRSEDSLKREQRHVVLLLVELLTPTFAHLRRGRRRSAATALAAAHDESVGRGARARRVCRRAASAAAVAARR